MSDAPNKPIDDKNLDAITDYCLQIIIDDLLKPEHSALMIETVSKIAMSDTVLPLYWHIHQDYAHVLKHYEGAVRAAFAHAFSQRLLKQKSETT